MEWDGMGMVSHHTSHITHRQALPLPLLRLSLSLSLSRLRLCLLLCPARVQFGALPVPSLTQSLGHFVVLGLTLFVVESGKRRDEGSRKSGADKMGIMKRVHVDDEARGRLRCGAQLVLDVLLENV